MEAQVELHPRSTFLSDFILGSQDGLVNVLGILLGLVAAGAEPSIIIIAALSALAAETISMGAVAYTSTLSRRLLYLSETRRELEEMRTMPAMEREEVRQILGKWGYEGADREEMLDRIAAKPKAMLDIMMAFELNLAEVPEGAPLRSFTVVLLATLFGSIIPLIPFFFLGSDTWTAAYIAIGLSAGLLFAVGWYEARTTLGSIWTSAIRMVLIGLGAGFAGFLVGYFLGAH